MQLTSAIPDVGLRARRRVAWRLLRFVFLRYVVAQLDRNNVAFAKSRMSADLGFSDRVYGLGVAMAVPSGRHFCDGTGTGHAFLPDGLTP